LPGHQKDRTVHYNFQLFFEFLEKLREFLTLPVSVGRSQVQRVKFTQKRRRRSMLEITHENHPPFEFSSAGPVFCYINNFNEIQFYMKIYKVLIKTHSPPQTQYRSYEKFLPFENSVFFLRKYDKNIGKWERKSNFTWDFFRLVNE
jgi:hypothetical protein